jgi:hypothetical protein
MCLMRCTTVPAVGAGMAWQRGLYGPKGGGILVGLSKMVGEQERSRARVHPTSMCRRF